MHLPLPLAIAISAPLLPGARANFDIYFEGPFDPSKYQDWAYRVFNDSDKAPSWAQVEAAPRFKRRDWTEKLGDDQIPEGEVGCRAPSDCSDLYGCDRACSANVRYNAEDIEVFDMHFHSDALAPFHWILHKQDEHKDRLGNNVTAAPDGGMWMYNAHSNVAPEGYCIVHAGAEYHGVKQELGDYFKHGVRKLRCIIADISADDINDPEAYKRRTAPETETDDRRHGKDPMAGCARRGDCSAGKGSGKVVSSSTGSGEIGTWRVVVWASTLVTVRTVSTLVVTEVEGRSTVRHEEGTTTAEAPASASTKEAETLSQSAETASSTDDTGASVQSLDIIPFEVAYSMTFTQTTLVTVVETMVKKIPRSSSSFLTVTSNTSRAVSSDTLDTTTSASASSTSVRVISYSSSQPSSISGTDSHKSKASSSLITSNTPTSSFSNSSSTSTDTSTPAPVQNPTGSSIPISGQNSATKLPTGVSTAASVVFVTVVVTASPQSSTQVYDDGMWHTYYPVRNT